MQEEGARAVQAPLGLNQPWGRVSAQVGLTCAYSQGAYGVVRLAYNESEDRHYVSPGIGGRCCPSLALETWGVGRRCAGKTEDSPVSEGRELPAPRGMQRK